MIRNKITKTDAKSKYFLSDRDFVNLSYSYGNSSKKSNSYSKLYVIDDILNVFKIKYQINDNQIHDKIVELSNLKINKKNNIEQNRINKKNKKRNELLNKLIEYKINYDNADDSIKDICDSFIDCNYDNDFDYIIDKCCKRKFLLEYTEYKSLFPKIVKLRQTFNLTEPIHNEFYYIGRHMLYSQPITQITEYAALYKVNGYPEVYPWMESSSL